MCQKSLLQALAYFTSSSLVFFNMTSTSRFPQNEHQSVSHMVLSGAGNQVFVNMHSNIVPVFFKFQANIYYHIVLTLTGN